MFDLGSIFVRIKAKTEEFDKSMDGLKKGADGAEKGVTDLRGGVEKLGQGMLAMGAVGAAGLLGIQQGVESALNAANKFQSAMIGLNSIARAFGQDADKAKVAAQRLASDGLMSVSDAAVGLKNLLAAGFSLDQAITLMERFKDSAAFARQGSLSFGEAIKGATEGIKNGNSILVDNAGVTKNLSMMLEEAGFSAQDLMKASSDAGVRMALFNGILKETNPQLGDAARFAETFAGAQSRAAAESEKTNQAIGEALQPVLLKFLEVITPLIQKIGEFAKAHPKLVAAIAVGLAVFFGLFAIIGAIGGVVALLVAGFSSMGAIIIGVVVGALALLAGAAVIIVSNWSSIVQFFTDIGTGIANVFTQMWTTITTWVSDVYNELVSFFSRIPGAIGQFFAQMFQAIVTWLTNTWNSATQLAGNIFNAIISFISQLPGAIAYWVGFALGWLLRQIIELPGNLLAAGEAVLKFFVDLFTNIYNGTVKWFSDTWNWLVESVKALPGRLLVAGAAVGLFFLDMIITVYRNVSNWIASTVDNVVNWVRSIPGKIGQFLGDIYNKAKELGQNLFNGFIDMIKSLPDKMWEILTSVVNKIKDFAGSVLQAAKDLGGKIWDGFKKGLGIQSPSYLEKAMMAIQDQGETTIEAMKRQVGTLSTFANRAKSIAGDVGVGGFEMGLTPAFAGSVAPVGGAAIQPMTVIQVDLAGANITSPQLAEEYAEAIGDGIIRKLHNTVRT